ncbi:MAG TPA: PIN domain-containing protein [Tepidisphaeraceae bacterium]|jgi:uncharacterized protein YacL
MVLSILRALFVLLMAAVGFFFVFRDPTPLNTTGVYDWLLPAIGITLAVFIVCADILAPRQKLAIFSGTFFGLIVGLIFAYVLGFVVRLLVEQYATGYKERLIEYINTMVSVACCYLSISFILQTKDDFRFIIPYVEFTKATKGARPILVDTSVLIDGRIVDVVNTGIIESQIVVPQFVIDELQLIADSGDKLKRNRGSRGLDVLRKLRSTEKVDVALYDASARVAAEKGVDQKLIALSTELSARLLTNDMNLNKVAQLRGVDVINLNDLANAMKPTVLPGEKMKVRIVKPGEDAGQGVGYLDDGTMVVVEGARSSVNREVEFLVTNTRQTSAGKMIFGRVTAADEHPPEPPAAAALPGPKPTPRPA